jgi:hypothetical protein
MARVLDRALSLLDASINVDDPFECVQGPAPAELNRAVSIVPDQPSQKAIPSEAEK